MFTAEDIAALKLALATGVSEVRYADGRQVKYRSLDEIRQVILMAQADIAPSTESRSFVAEF
ncbi:phage head-tail joining protein [Sphingomonas sanguinis]|uniref:Uncharacterized protein n=1 Tax=Sphingomonas sanguinis TaxID=33051 RepID=A0A147HYT1_9SPHN|nr:hypothetical protein [Sphingomonas sanguinis]KTT70160.1 hypothetical protein NS319_08425 [Sphingomonas sanguinis]